MTDGGWLDGFPLHLLFARDPSPSLPVLCLDEDVLGNVQLSPCPGPTPVVVVYGDGGAAASAREVSPTESVVWRVVADPNQLPFRRASLSGWIECAGGGADRSDAAARRSEPVATRSEGQESERVLAADAVFVRIASDPAALENPATDPTPPPVSRFEIRPRSGAEYFVTRIPGPQRSPFRNLQLGKTAALREQVPSWMPWPSPPSLILDVRSIRRTCIDDFWAREAECGLFVKSNWNALLVGDEHSVLKFPLLFAGVDRLRAQADQLAQVRQELPSNLAEFVPSPLELGLRAGQFFLRESVRPGRPIPLSWWKPRGSKTAYRSAAEFLIDWHRGVGKGEPLDRDTAHALLSDRIVQVTTAGQQIDDGFSLDEFQDRLRARLVGQRIPRVRTHGDFWGGNLLVGASGELTGVLDWDASNPEGWPLVDLYHLLTYRKKRRAYWKFGDRVTNWLLPEAWSSWETDLVDRYCAELNLSARHRETLKVVYWLERTYQWWLTNSSENWIDHDWIRRNIVETVPRLTSLLREAD